MSEIQGHKSNKISPLDRLKDEYPSFIIEIAGEPLLHACLHWSQTSDFTTTYNGQNQRQNRTYDAAGNPLNDTGNQYIYDAAGRNVSAGGVTQAFDGLGQVIKGYDNDYGLTYYLHSTPLGGRVLTELYGATVSQVPVGAKIRGYVYAGGVLVAKQAKVGVNLGSSQVEWQHRDDLAGSLAASYNTTTSNGNFTARQEPDPLGANLGLDDPLGNPPDPEAGDTRLMDVPGFFPDGRCQINGVSTGCAMVSSLLSSGAAVVAPQQTTRWNFTTQRFEFFKATAQGSGWANSSGKFGAWVLTGEKTRFFNRATEDVVSKDGRIVINKGDPVIGIEGSEHWEYVYGDKPESVDVTAGEFIGGGGLFQSRQSQIPRITSNLPGIQPNSPQAPRCGPGGNSGDSSSGGDRPAVGRVGPSTGTGPRVITDNGGGGGIGPGAAALAGVAVLILVSLWKKGGDPYQSPCPKPVPVSPEAAKGNRWTCIARAHINNFSNVPDAPGMVEATASGPTESAACIAAMDLAVSMAPRGTTARHPHCIRCWTH